MAEQQHPKVPDHTVVSAIAVGGQGSVFLARHDRLGRLVAPKVVGTSAVVDEHFRERFEREATTAGGRNHPNIVPVHEFGLTQDGRPFLTMPYFPDGSLKELLEKRGPLPVGEALALTKQIAEALREAHCRNVVHSSTGAILGTPGCLSPEQAQGNAIDQRADIYALGVVLYRMVTGRLPIAADRVVGCIGAVLMKPPEPLPVELSGLQPFMTLLLAKDPAQRLGGCSDVISVIDAMVRNWIRYRSVDRLSEGIVMAASGRDAPTLHLDAHPPASPVEPAPLALPVAERTPPEPRSYSGTSLTLTPSEPEPEPEPEPPP